jgi:hypothetical protein
MLSEQRAIERIEGRRENRRPSSEQMAVERIEGHKGDRGL